MLLGPPPPSTSQLVYLGLAVLLAAPLRSPVLAGVSQTSIDSLKDEADRRPNEFNVADLFSWGRQKNRRRHHEPLIASDEVVVLERQMRSVYPKEGQPPMQQQHGGFVDMNGWMPKVSSFFNHQSNRD